MSRFGTLQQQYRENARNWSNHLDYLALHAEELADDFGLWLAQAESGEPDPFCTPIPVKALAHLVDDEFEDIFSDDIMAGALGDTLNFALEVRVADGDHTKPPSVLRLKLAVEPAGDEVKVTTGRLHRHFLYRRDTVPEALFAELFSICQEELSV